MKVLVDIRDSEANFGMKVLQSLTFVKKAKPMTNAAVELWEDLKNAAQDVRLHKQGKLNLKTAQDLLKNIPLSKTNLPRAGKSTDGNTKRNATFRSLIIRK